MTSMLGRLAAFPKLQAWFEQQTKQARRPTDHPLHTVKWQLCHALAHPTDDAYSIWKSVLDTFFSRSTSPGQDYQELSEFFATKGLSLHHLATEMGTHAFLSEQGKSFYELMNKAAAKTSLVSFYFLAAWAALNDNDHTNCIRLCQSIEEDFAAIHTLHGQALLELGYAAKAAEILELATELEPHDPLIWFQLAKAEMVQSKHEAAWNALEVCAKLAPKNPEIALFFTLLACEQPAQRAWQQIAWDHLSPHLNTEAQNCAVIVPLLKLAFLAGNKQWAQKVVTQVNWQNLGDKLVQAKELSFILKELAKKNWHDLASIVLKEMTRQLEN